MGNRISALNKRSMHGGDDSHLSVEVSAVRGFGAADGIETCNHEPDAAEAFAVYIRNPLAFHIRDFKVWRRPARPDAPEGWKAAKLADAKAEAFAWGDGLADHLGCAVVSALARKEGV